MKTISRFTSALRIAFLLFLSFYSINSMAFLETSALEMDCHRVGGQLINSWQCPSSKDQRFTEDGKYFCMVITKKNIPIVFDGCSTPEGTYPEYSEFFYESCKRHDICYHNTLEHTTEGKRKCDLNFYHNMIETCKNRMGEKSVWGECGTTASVFYQAVETFGDTAFSCSNVPVDPSDYAQFYNERNYVNIWNQISYQEQ